MTVDLSALLRGEVQKITVDADITPDSAPDGIQLMPGAHITGTIEDNGGYIRLTSEASVPYRGQCARCLDTVEGTLRFPFDRTLVSEGMVGKEELEENEEEYLVIHRGFIDPDSAISESVFLEFPMLLLCSPDCQGLCPGCGRRLSGGGSCSCSQNNIDPRWQKLRELLKDGPDEDIK